MAMISTGIEAKEIYNYLAKKLNLPKSVVWFELRMGVDEIITVRCEFNPEVVPDNQDEAGAGVV